MKTVAAVLVLSLFACGNTPPAQSAAAAATTHAKAPQSLDEAIRAQGLVPIALSAKQHGVSYELGKAPVVRGRTLVMTETAGWNASHAKFAQRRDGTVYLVIPKRIEIVDRHVPGGCRNFYGGRGWFEEVEYELPEGATYGGTIDAAYEDHVEIKDWSDTQPDGSPCPPPMID